MAEAFDPYFKWLGIPQSEQPPNHYRLLGVPEFVDDADVIEHAADQRMNHLRTFSVGEHTAVSQRILNEVARARVVLLNPRTKAEYDAQLRKTLAPRQPAQEQPATARPTLRTRDAGPVHAAAAQPAALTQPPAPTVRSEPVQRSHRTGRRSLSPAIMGAGVALVALAVVVVLFLRRGPSPEPADANKTVARSERPAQELPGASRPANREQPLSTSRPTQDDDASQPADEPPLETPKVPMGKSPSPVKPPTVTPDAPGAGKPPLEAEPPGKEIPASGPKRPVVQMSAAPVEPGPGPKQPIPAGDALREARREVFDRFGNQVRAARDPAAKAQLAAELFARGQEAKDGSAAQYAWYAEANKLATASGVAEIAVESVDALAKDFEIDAWSMKIEALQTAARQSNTIEQIQGTAVIAEQVAQAAYDARAFEEALKVAQIAETLGRRAQNAPYVQQVRRRMAEIRDAQSQHERQLADDAQREASVEQAKAVLAERPADPEANFTIGTYLAFEQNNWDAGLAHLSKSNVVGVARTAARDLAAIEPSLDECIELADAWWDLADGAGKLERAGFLFRAGLWYEAALPFVAVGLSKQRIGERLAAIYDQVSGSTALAGAAVHRILARDALLIMTFDENTLSRRGGQLVVHDLSGSGKQGAVIGATPRPGRAGQALAFDGEDDHVDLTDFRLNLTDYTVAVWIRGQGTVLGTGQNREWPMFWMLATDRLVHHIEPFRGGGREYDNATNRDTLAIEPLPDSEWKHLVATRRGSALRIYVDGKLAAEKAPYHVQPFVTHEDWGQFLGMLKTWGTTSVSIGGPLPRIRRFTGLIDELAILERALQDHEIRAVYQLGTRGQSLPSAPQR